MTAPSALRCATRPRGTMIWHSGLRGGWGEANWASEVRRDQILTGPTPPLQGITQGLFSYCPEGDPVGDAAALQNRAVGFKVSSRSLALPR